MSLFDDIKKGLDDVMHSNYEKQSVMTFGYLLGILIEEMNRQDSENGHYVGSEKGWRHHLSNAMDFRGKSNKHLENPLNRLQVGHPDHKFWTRDRENPLEETAIINGRFLMFDYVGHQGIATILEYESLEAVEKALLSDGGLGNMFVSYLIPIVDGKVKRLKYNEDNNTLEWLS